MRILHVIPTLDPRAGGPPLIASHLAAAQVLLGHEVHVMTYRSREDGAERITSENKSNAGFDRVRQHLLPHITWRERIIGNDALASAKQLVPKMDVLHLHGIWEPQLIHAAAVARQHHKPYLVLLHGMLLPWPMARGIWKKRIVMAVGARAMLNGGLLHFHSEDERFAAAALGFAKPSVIIPNGTSCDSAADLPGPDIFHEMFPGLGRNDYILFLGRLHEQKGLDLLLAAFELVLIKQPQARLVIAGPDFGRSQELSRRITAAGIQERILLTGPLYGRQKLAALRGAACFCLPSRHEGFSVAVLEALACGTPVVISPECHFPRVAEMGAGLIPSLDARAIADALVRMLDDEAFRQSASIAAKNLAANEFTWARVAEQTIKAYHRSLGGEP